MAIFQQQNQNVTNQYNADVFNFTINKENTDRINKIGTLKIIDSGLNIDIDSLLKILREGNIEKTLENMEKIQDLDIHKSVTILNARFAIAKRNKIEGTSDSNEYNLEINKIIHSILEIINLIQK